jgi:two-component system, chemotaxis family, chemotaxis protein CheY
MVINKSIDDVLVLLVDDDKIPRVILSRALKELGINNILTAENGQSALQILFTESVDIVVSDWNMPVMDGLEFFRSVKGNGRLSSIPFLLLTSKNSKDEVMKALKVGIKNYIIKSNDTEPFKDKIKSMLGVG